ncbi:MAG: hypothetical protein EOP91_00130 [Lysobacteraceae bacterium]|nr:MAG: hypothetical protein EOP91_00130 [Xanthomonadaceae bacterium]
MNRAQPAARRPRRPVLRTLLAAAAVLAMLGLALQLGRIDAGLGRPSGPERLLKSLDASPGISPEDAATARRILADRPLDGSAYRVLAQVAGQSGQATEAGQAYRTAVARWPRDRVARAALAEQAFLAGDIETGLEHVDALLRLAPASRAEMLGVLMPALGDPRLRQGLAARLAADPPWRGALPAALTAEDTDPAAAEALLAALAARQALPPAEMQARIVVLDRLGRAGQARQLWVDGLAAEDRAVAGLVHDGGFERPALSGGYAWQYQVPAGVGLGHDQAQPFAGKASLALEFGGRAVQFSGVRQVLALAPGRYRLQLAARNQVDSTRPFLWRIGCNGQPGAPLAELEVPPSPQWQTLAAAFEVPAACTAQTLQLLHPARSMSERQLRGSLAFDAVEIAPL